MSFEAFLRHMHAFGKKSDKSAPYARFSANNNEFFGTSHLKITAIGTKSLYGEKLQLLL